jgi:two-component system, sensor histidine kinase PdtaS
MNRFYYWVFLLLLADNASSQLTMPVDSGMVYYGNGIKLTRNYEFVKAREQLLKAQKWFILQNRQEELGKTFIQLGFQTNRIQMFEKSHEYFSMAEIIAEKNELTELDFYAKTAHAISYLWDFGYSRDTTRLKTAKSILLDLQSRNSDGIEHQIFNDYLEVWGDYYMKTQQPDTALIYFNRSLEIGIADSNHASITNCYINIALCYYTKNQLDTIPTLLNKALDEERKDRNMLLRGRIYNAFWAYFEKKEDFKNAFRYLKYFTSVTRIELLADRDLALSRLSGEFDKQLLEAQLGEKDLMVRFQKFLIIIMSAIFMLTLVFAFSYFRLYRLNKAVNQKNRYLLKEQNHRLKNNLQIISGLLGLQANRIAEEETRNMIEASQLRVHTIGLIHKQLYENSTEEVNVGLYGNELVNQIVVSFDIKNITKDVVLYDIYLPSDVVNSIGLIMNELLTNSCKYAYPGNPNPRLYLRFFKLADESYKLIYKDNGPGFNINKTKSKRKSQSSFGLTLIDIQVAQLEGKAKWKNMKGIHFELTFQSRKKWNSPD